MIGEIVKLTGQQVFSGCVGVVIDQVSGTRPPVYQVHLADGYTVVRRQCDITVLTHEEVGDPNFCPPTPASQLKEFKRHGLMAGLFASIEQGNDKYAQSCADQIAELEAKYHE